jgi:hypothetical protein
LGVRLLVVARPTCFIDLVNYDPGLQVVQAKLLLDGLGDIDGPIAGARFEWTTRP